MRIRILIFFYVNPDPDPRFQTKAQTLEKVLKQGHIPYIFACHLQIDAGPDPFPDPKLRVVNMAVIDQGIGMLICI
jgi:hypothetical protein